MELRKESAQNLPLKFSNLSDKISNILKIVEQQEGCSRKAFNTGLGTENFKALNPTSKAAGSDAVGRNHHGALNGRYLAERENTLVLYC
jgi:hypothetical protein